MTNEDRIVIVQKRRVNHGMHFILTLLTGGLWLPIWIIRSLIQ